MFATPTGSYRTTTSVGTGNIHLKVAYNICEYRTRLICISAPSLAR